MTKITTYEFQKQDTWKEIETIIESAKAKFLLEYPNSKVELIQQKYRWLLTVDKIPTMEITVESLFNLN